MKVLKQNVYAVPVLNIKNHLHINNSKMELKQVKCKDIYWHLINNITHIPKAILAWENVYKSEKQRRQILENSFHNSIHCTMRLKITIISI